MADSTKFVTSTAFSRFWSNMENYVLPKYIEKTGASITAGTYSTVTINEYGVVTAATEKVSASKIDGIIPIANLPAAAVERLYVATDKTAMLSLTFNDVQNGDTVKDAATGLMYFVKDDTKLAAVPTEGEAVTAIDEATFAEVYELYVSGEAASVDWANVKNAPTAIKNPNALTIKYADGTTADKSYDGSAAVEITIPNKLSNPNALTVTLPDGTSVEYDGAAAKTVNITTESLKIAEVTADEIDTLMASWLPAQQGGGDAQQGGETQNNPEGGES